MFKATYRVYYEDTDAGGVVYYANYLKFAERARTDWLREKGISQTGLQKEQGIMFVVRDVTMKLKKPARLDDMLEVSVSVKEAKRASVVLTQYITCQGKELASIEVCVVSVDRQFKPVALPNKLI
jgi:acyl-CoA thioester hydrolase